MVDREAAGIAYTSLAVQTTRQTLQLIVGREEAFMTVYGGRCCYCTNDSLIDISHNSRLVIAIRRGILDDAHRIYPKVPEFQTSSGGNNILKSERERIDADRFLEGRFFALEQFCRGRFTPTMAQS